MSYEDLQHKTPEYMLLPKMKFKLSLEEFRNDESLKNAYLDIITRNNMANYYEDVCKEFCWEIDETLLNSMHASNKTAWDQLDSSDIALDLDESAEKNWQDKLEFALKIGDLERATEMARTILEDTRQTSSNRVTAAFANFRVAYVKSNVTTMGKFISVITKLLEENSASNSNWCCRNRLKAYEAVFCLATRNFARANSLLLDCIPTFESYELLTFKNLVEYTVLSAIISLSRSELDKKLNNNGILQQALQSECPKYREYLRSLYDCHYADFFRSLAWIESEMKVDPLLHPHYRYYVRNVRLKSYAQILQAYRSLSLSRMATEFGVTEEYLEQDIARFIAGGRLHCKIDKISGAIVTVNSNDCDGARAPDDSCNRGLVYQNTIKRGDALLNRLKKLGRVVDF